MTTSSPLNFANRDLRNRSFKGQNLKGANFSGADIRGCDFSYALLQEANFERVRAGQSPRQLMALVMVTGVVAVLAADAFSQMMFGILGRTPAEGRWSFVIALYVSLAIAGTFCAIRVMAGTKSMIGRIATIVSGAGSGALLGFFYGGSIGDNNPQMAIAGAVLGGIIGAIASALGTRSIAGRIPLIGFGAVIGYYYAKTIMEIGFYFTGNSIDKNLQLAIASTSMVIGGAIVALICWRVRREFVTVAVSIVGAVAGYGLAFVLGANAIAHLSVQKFIWGVIWGILSAGYIWLTMNSFTLAVREIRGAFGTSFRGADLTNAKFDEARLQNTDFSGAVGHPS